MLSMAWKLRAADNRNGAHWDASERSPIGTVVTRRGNYTPDKELERQVEARYGKPMLVAPVMWIFEGTDYERAASGVLVFAERIIEKSTIDRRFSACLMEAQREADRDPNRLGDPVLAMVFTAIPGSVDDEAMQRLPDLIVDDVNHLLDDVQSPLQLPVFPDPYYFPAVK